MTVSPLATVREALERCHRFVGPTSKTGYLLITSRKIEEALAVLDSLDGTITLSREEAENVVLALRDPNALSPYVRPAIALLAARIEESK